MQVADAHKLALSVLPDKPRDVHRFISGDRVKLRDHTRALVSFFKDRPVNTQRAYAAALRQFFNSLDWIPPEEVTDRHAVAFKIALQQSGRHDSTVYSRLSAMSSYFTHLMETRGENGQPILARNAFKEMCRDDVMPVRPEVSPSVTATIFNRLYSAIPADPRGLRDRAVLTFLAAGCGRQQVADLRIRNLRLDKPRTFHVETYYGFVERPVTRVLYRSVRAYWLAADRLAVLRPPSAVFTDAFPHRSSLRRFHDKRPEDPLCAAQIRRILIRATELAGLTEQNIRISAIRKLGQNKSELKKIMGPVKQLADKFHTAVSGGDERTRTMFMSKLEDSWLIPELQEAVADLVEEEVERYEQRYPEEMGLVG